MKSRAQMRELKLKGFRLPTPIVVPSFSSRVKPPDPLQAFLERLLPSISGPVLFSAYDIHHRHGLAGYDFTSQMTELEPFLVFMDSGGYEVIWNELAEQAGILRSVDPIEWQRNDYLSFLSGWPSCIPLIAVTFDDPKNRSSMQDQLAAAVELAARFPDFSINFLLKPPIGKNGDFESTLELSDVAPFVQELESFPLIGVTEKEIGASMKDRLTFLAGFRDLLDDAGLDTPIHVFGGLDPMMTPLYFLAGADVFDGLSWLRYAFKDGTSLYDQGFVATKNPRLPISSAIWDMRERNLRSLTDLEVSMKKQLLGSSVQEAFGPLGNEIKLVWDSIWNDEE